MVFASDRDLTGENADLNSEIFLHDTTSNSFTQVTHTTGGSLGFGNVLPTISGDGKRIAFASDRDLTGGNVDGNQEIFSTTRQRTALRRLPIQLGYPSEP